MADTEDDPWASLRAASSDKHEAGRLAHMENARRTSAGSWLSLWLREDVLGWLQKQLPDASTTLDSSYYLGIHRRKGRVKDATRMVFGREQMRDVKRVPVVILGRRIGLPGLLVVALIGVATLAISRSVIGI